MRLCLTQHPGPVLAYVTVLHLDDGTQLESGPFIDYNAAESFGRLSLLAADVVTYAVQTRLAERIDS